MRLSSQKIGANPRGRPGGQAHPQVPFPERPMVPSTGDHRALRTVGGEGLPLPQIIEKIPVSFVVFSIPRLYHAFNISLTDSVVT
jgi:hypothetical protein